MNEKEMNVNLRDALINQVNKHLSDAAALFDLLHFLDDKKTLDYMGVSHGFTEVVMKYDREGEK